MYLNEDNFREYKDKIVLKKNKDKIKQNAFNSIDAFSEKTFYNNIIEVYKRAIRRNW